MADALSPKGITLPIYRGRSLDMQYIDPSSGMTFANDFDTCPESLPSSQQSSCNLTGLWQSGVRTEIRFAPCERFSPYVLKDTSGEILIESGSKGKG